MATAEPNKPQPTEVQLQLVDLPAISETFADHLRIVSFDGQVLRLEFGVTRLDDRKQGSPQTGRRYPSCRLVLTPGAAVELINQMQRIAANLVQAGILKAEPPKTAQPQ